MIVQMVILMMVLLMIVEMMAMVLLIVVVMMELMEVKNIPLDERVNCACVRPALLYTVETWALTERLEGLLASCDHRMLRFMSGVRWRDRITNKDVRRRCELENIGHRLRKTRLKWFGHLIWQRISGGDSYHV